MGVDVEQYPKIMELFLRKVKLNHPFLLILNVPRLRKVHPLFTIPLPFLPFPGDQFTAAQHQNCPLFRKPNVQRAVL
jgi:hypothetical protein